MTVQDLVQRLPIMGLAHKVFSCYLTVYTDKVERTDSEEKYEYLLSMAIGQFFLGGGGGG